jgi:hypothetical protein
MLARIKRAAPPRDVELGGGTENGGAGGAAVQARGAYEVDEHHLSPREVAQRFSTEVDFSNVGGSCGLTSSQVCTRPDWARTAAANCCSPASSCCAAGVGGL